MDKLSDVSLAEPFKSIGAFPFCPVSAAGSVYDSHVGNLTLAQVMAFAWNLESITFAFDGTLTSPPDEDPPYESSIVYATGYITTKPPASDMWDVLQNNEGNMLYGDAFLEVPTGSFPSPRQPKERVCLGAGFVEWNGSAYVVNPAAAAVGTVLAIGGLGEQSFGYFYFYVRTDPSNAGKYRLYYRLSFEFSDERSDTLQVWFENRPGPIAGTTEWQNGTFTIGGITMTWYSRHTTGPHVASGPGAMTATATFFTYP